MNIEQMTEDEATLLLADKIGFGDSDLQTVNRGDLMSIIRAVEAARDAQWNALIAGQAGHHEEQPDGTVTLVDPTDRGFKAEQAEAPFKLIPYEPTGAMRWAMKQIDPALTHEQCRALWSSAWTAATQPTASNAGEREALLSALLRRARPYVDEAARRFYDGTGGRGNRENAQRLLGQIDSAALASKPPAGEQKPVAEVLHDAKFGCKAGQLFIDLPVGTKLYSEPVTPPAREALQAVLNDPVIDGMSARIRNQAAEDGRPNPLDLVRAALSATPPAQAVQTEDTQLLNWLRDECCDLRCISVPTGGDDYDVRWVVIQHHMAEPREREIGESFTDDPRDAIRAARTRGNGVEPS